jgi:1-aminocyclopropane-1-carboxylate deaminase/D-cysteine desulfhydrase-like pyridoxal-dependent ACC family enzyme
MILIKNIMNNKLKDWGTIFPKLSIDNKEIDWSDYLYSDTPVQNINGLWFKREDMFAPLGYGGINGSKLRQAIWLVNNFHKGKNTLISGASIKSPQLPMGSAVAMHYGLKSHHIIGATNPVSAIKKENVKMATWFGASFEILKVGYNPVLQSRVNKILKEKDLKLSYGITVNDDCTNQNVYDFHHIGANQTFNIPDCIENIVIPTGSGNTTISILLGLSHKRPKNLKNVYLIGVGNNKMSFINKRLNQIKNISNTNVFNFKKQFEDLNLNQDDKFDSYNLYYYDLISSGYTTYGDDVKLQYEDIEFHPTYEAKMMKYIIEELPNLLEDNTLFWIVGSKPRLDSMINKGINTGIDFSKIKLENYEI